MGEGSPSKKYLVHRHHDNLVSLYFCFMEHVLRDQHGVLDGTQVWLRAEFKSYIVSASKLQDDYIHFPEAFGITGQYMTGEQ